MSDGASQKFLQILSKRRESIPNKDSKEGMHVIPATWKKETGGFWFEASLREVNRNPYLKNKA
jgi:hypothetical protein